VHEFTGGTENEFEFQKKTVLLVTLADYSDKNTTTDKKVDFKQRSNSFLLKYMY